MAELTPLFMDISGEYSGDELAAMFRLALSEGVVNKPNSDALKVVQRGAGANLSVDVNAGECVVKGDTSAFQPSYICRNDATVNLGITPDASQSRVVRVVAQVTDETFSGTGRDWELVALHGTPGGSAPAEPDSALTLALVAVAAAETQIETADITDSRTYARIGGGDVPGASIPIYDSTLTATAASVDIQNIPQIYNALKLMIYGRGDTAATTMNVLMRFNNDQNGNYDTQRLSAAAATASGSEEFAQTSHTATIMPAANATASVFGMFEILIPNYAGTVGNKVWNGVGGYKIGTATTNLIARTTTGFWRSSAAISRITLTPSAGNWAIGSRVTLHGIT